MAYEHVITLASTLWLISAGAPAGAEARVAYVVDAYGNQVFPVELATMEVRDPIQVGATPTGIAIRPDGKRAYVANWDSHSVSVIDTRSNTVVATIPDLITPEQIAVAPDGRTVYVVEVLGHSVAASTRTRTSS